MKIIQLTASNIKRLRAVEITPDSTLQVVGGRNAQGKSSVLDAIWLALGGGKAAKETSLPIRDGENHASVTLDLGDIIVTRSWTQKGTTLKVSSPDGATYSSPQSMLDALVGRLSFDPLAFTRLSARDQREELIKLVDLDVDVDALDAERSRVFAERAEIGRQGKAIGEVTVDEDLPETETSASEIISRIRAAEDANREIELAQRSLQESAAAAADLAYRISQLKQELEAVEAAQTSLSGWLAHHQKTDTSPLEEDLAGIEDTNARIRANNAARAQARQRASLRAQYEVATATIADLDSRKATALAAANFPVPGLGFDESGVTYQGVPFSQASSAEQIRVSLAMAMALNPKLRVLRILDGSLLDADGLALIREQAEAGDFQLWVERVGDADEGAVIIEDGTVQ